MTRFRWPILIALAGGAIVFLLLMVFRSDTAGDAQPREKQPVPGGEYTEALVGALQRLNPIFDFRNPVDRDVDRLVFSGLVR